MSRVRAIFELLRVSNLPTVWSNVLVGMAAGYAAKKLSDGARVGMSDTALLGDRWFALALLLVALACSAFYLAGMALNDLLDAAVDRRQRPSRPVPSGRVARPVAWALVMVLFAIGFAALWPFHQRRVLMIAGLLAACIVTYNVVHHRSVLSVLLMGMCRALVVVLASSVYPVGGWPWADVVLPFAVALGVYTTGLSLAARGEVGRPDMVARVIGWPMIVVVFTPALWLWPSGRGLWVAAAAGVLVALWLGGAAWQMARPRAQPVAAILGWLSGVALVDVWFLALLGRPVFAALAAGCFLATVAGHRRIKGT